MNPWLCEGHSNPFRFVFLISKMEMMGTLWGLWGVGENVCRDQVSVIIVIMCCLFLHQENNSRSSRYISLKIEMLNISIRSSLMFSFHNMIFQESE